MKTFFSHSQLRIKICGLKTLEEAQVAVHAGADALGFNFYPYSKRYIPIELALSFLSTLPCKVTRIAVVVNPTSTMLRYLLTSRLFDAIQFHGDESPEFCKHSGFPIWIKAIQTSNYALTQKHVRSFSSPYLLLDSCACSGEYGGTGKLVNFFVAARIVRSFPHKHFLLAGGLHPENVKKAISVVQPFGVDVASGVEDNCGRKTEEKIRAFINAAKGSVTKTLRL